MAKVSFGKRMIDALRRHREALECAGIVAVAGWMVAYATYLLKC